MKKISILFASLLLLGSVACERDNSENITPTSDAKIVELTASTAADTRISLELSADAQSIDLGWELGDSFDVYTADDTYVGAFNFNGTEGSPSGSFVSNAEVVMSSGDEYVAYFPSKGAVVSLQASSQSTNSSVGHLYSSVIMSAEFTYNSEATSFVFKHDAAIIGFEFELETTPAKFVYNDGAGRDYTVNYTGEATAENLYTLYVAVNPTSDEMREVSILVYDDQSCEYEFNKSVSMATVAGYFYKLSISELTEIEYPTWSVGEIIYDDDNIEPIGMIIWVDESDNTQAMALAFECFHGVWDSNNPSSQDTSLDDSIYRAVGAGDDCYEIISKFEDYGDTFEIFKWAQGLGDHWHITTVYDLTNVIIPAFQVKSSWSGALDSDSGLNKKFVEAGGECIALSDLGFTVDNTSDCVRYWTCNTSSTGTKARCVRLYDSSHSWSTFDWNSEVPYARAVRYINM